MYVYDIKTILGKNIKIYRKKSGLTQERFSEDIDCSLSHLANIEIGKKYPGPELLSLIAERLNVKPSALFVTTDEETLYSVVSEVIETLEYQNEKNDSILQKLNKNRIIDN